MPTDAQLVIAALDDASDESDASFAALYDRFADAIHTFCYGRLRDDADAADALEETFVRAHRRLPRLTDPALVRPWLFAIARTTVVDLARARGGHDRRRDWGPIAGRANASPAALLWDAAAGLQPGDQELIELHLRAGLDGADLAMALDVDPAHVSVMIKRMKTRLSTAVGSLLVARDGREHCRDLDTLLADWDGRFSVAVRSTIARHVEACDTCYETRRTIVSWESMAAAMPAPPAPPAVRPVVMTVIAGGDSNRRGDREFTTRTPSEPSPAAPAPVDALPRDRDDGNGEAPAGARPRSGHLVGTALSFVLVAVVLTGTALAWPVISRSSPDVVVTEVAGVRVESTSTAPPTTTAPPATTTTTTTIPAAPVPFVSDPGPIVFPLGATTVEHTITNAGDQPRSWAAITAPPFAFQILGAPSPTVSGTLVGGTSITLRIGVDTAAPPGDHAGSVVIVTTAGDVAIPLLVAAPRP